jgi:hypothetical protein
VKTISEILKLGDIMNPYYGTKKVLIKRGPDLDDKITLSEDDEILAVYAYSAMFSKDLLFVLTNYKLYGFIGNEFISKTFSKKGIWDGVQIEESIFNQTNIIYKGQTYITALAWANRTGLQESIDAIQGDINLDEEEKKSTMESIAKDLLKLKELFEAEIITKEEFDKKKEELKAKLLKK